MIEIKYVHSKGQVISEFSKKRQKIKEFLPRNLKSGQTKNKGILLS